MGVPPTVLCNVVLTPMRVEALPTGPSHAGLRFVEVLRDRVGGIEGLVQPPGLAISPDGKHVYVAAAGSKAVTAFRRDALTGRLTPLQVQRDGLDAIPRAAPYDIAIRR
ncbi:lactonase family protein [Candidatus Binatia bacterium]|nr:lactonase family protein [Candidatus Binatia bacterium]